jgi:genome maintenance exonuclease 1
MFERVTDIVPLEMDTEMVEGKRYYLTPSGEKYASITTVISNNSKKQAGLARWRKRVGEKKAAAITSKSVRRGTRYHKLVEDYLDNKDLNILDIENKEQPLPWLMFHSSVKSLDNINRIYLQEAALYSDVLQIAGRVDCIAEYEGKLSIIDFKTSKKPKEEYYMYDYYVQETAYACCFKEMYGLDVEQLVTIVACENGDTQVKIVPPRKEYLLQLKEYLKEYWEKYDRKTGG